RLLGSGLGLRNGINNRRLSDRWGLRGTSLDVELEWSSTTTAVNIPSCSVAPACARSIFVQAKLGPRCRDSSLWTNQFLLDRLFTREGDDTNSFWEPVKREADTLTILGVTRLDVGVRRRSRENEHNHCSCSSSKNLLHFGLLLGKCV